MLFILLVLLVNKIECVLSETANRTMNTVMFLPINKLLNLEESGTDAVVHFVMVYEGGVAYIPWGRKGQKNQTLMFLNKVTTDLFAPIPQEENRIFEVGSNIVIYHVKLSDAGIYQFSKGENDASVIVLEVVTYEKSPLTLPNYDIEFEDEHQLVVYSLWSPWSECSVCGDDAGRKRRFGICYVKNKKGYRHTGTSKDILEAFKGMPCGVVCKNFYNICRKMHIEMMLFALDGMPCRSQYLPNDLRMLPALIMGRNKIEISECKVPCEHIIFEASVNGTVVERANNSAGIYSLKQPLPEQPPPPGREVVFAARGRPAVVRCPGSVNRDIPLRWRVGRGWLKTNTARVHVSGRDDLIIETVTDEDDNLYRCWADRQLLGSVRVVVWGGAHQWDHHCALAALIVFTAALLRAVYAMLRWVG